MNFFTTTSTDIKGFCLTGFCLTETFDKTSFEVYSNQLIVGELWAGDELP